MKYAEFSVAHADATKAQGQFFAVYCPLIPGDDSQRDNLLLGIVTLMLDIRSRQLVSGTIVGAILGLNFAAQRRFDALTTCWW